MYEPNKILSAGIGLTDSQIKDVETRLKMKFPDSLAKFYKFSNGGRPARQTYISPSKERSFVHEFLEICGKPNEGFELAWDVCHIDPGFMPDGLFPFAIDEGGAFYCVRNDDKMIIFFDPTNADKPDRAVSEVAPSIETFIREMI